VIAIRFDIDTYHGLVDRTPALLDVLDEFNVRATFFCVMGPEANAIDVLRLRFLKRGIRKGKLRAKRKGGPAYLVCAALFPKWVGARNPERLLEITRRGHEVQPHGWKHIQWQRDLAGINVRHHLRKAVNAYRAVFGEPPMGFASPGRVYNRQTLEMMDEFGFAYAGDMDGDQPFRPEGCRHLQIPVTMFRTIDEMRDEGMSDDGIVDRFIHEIETRKDFCCFYEHPDNLFDSEFAILRRVYRYILDHGLPTVAHRDVVRRYSSGQ